MHLSLLQMRQYLIYNIILNKLWYCVCVLIDFMIALFRGDGMLDAETLKLSTQRTLMLGETPSEADEPDDVDGELDVPFGAFVCNHCSDPNDKSAVMKLVNAWLDRRIHMGDCQKLDPDMQNNVDMMVILEKSLKETTRTKNEMVQSEEELKQKLSTAVQAMKKRQYTLCLQRCPEHNPYDAEDYITAVRNIHDWEQGKLNSHRNEIHKLEEMEMDTKRKRHDVALVLAKVAYDTITKADQALNNAASPGVISPEVDPEFMRELEVLVGSHDKAGGASK